MKRTSYLSWAMVSACLLSASAGYAMDIGDSRLHANGRPLVTPRKNLVAAVLKETASTGDVKVKPPTKPRGKSTLSAQEVPVVAARSSLVAAVTPSTGESQAAPRSTSPTKEAEGVATVVNTKPSVPVKKKCTLEAEVPGAASDPRSGAKKTAGLSGRIQALHNAIAVASAPSAPVAFVPGKLEISETQGLCLILEGHISAVSKDPKRAEQYKQNVITGGSIFCIGETLDDAKLEEFFAPPEEKVYSLTIENTQVSSEAHGRSC